MTYFGLRFKIYQEAIKQILLSLKQLLLFLSLLLQVVLPAAILTALISLSIIESNTTTIDTRIVYQWGYFVFLFFLIRVQKKAILGEANSYYLASIPVTKVHQYCSNILLISCAGNLPLLVPLLFLIANIDICLSSEHLYFSLFVIATLLTTWLAVNGRHLPWGSLLLFPIVMLVYTNDLPESLSSSRLNYYWLITLLIDCLYKSMPRIKKIQLPMKHYWLIRWIAIQANPTPLLGRVFICGLLIVLVNYAQSELETIALVNIQIAVCYLISLLVGSLQFDNEKFHLRYRLYLASTLLSLQYRYLLDTFPAILMALLMTLTLHNLLSFSLLVSISMPIGTLITLLSVTKYKRNFFITPSVFFILCFAFS
jgi:hypothetical protein